MLANSAVDLVLSTVRFCQNMKRARASIKRFQRIAMKRQRLRGARGRKAMAPLPLGAYDGAL